MATVKNPDREGNVHQVCWDEIQFPDVVKFSGENNEFDTCNQLYSKPVVSVSGTLMIIKGFKDSSSSVSTSDDSLDHMTPSSKPLKYIIHECCQLPPERHATIMELPLVGLLHMQM